MPAPIFDKRFANGGLWKFPCAHEHINGRRCGQRVSAPGSCCSVHQVLDRWKHCNDCHAMADAFGVRLDCMQIDPRIFNALNDHHGGMRR